MIYARSYYARYIRTARLLFAISAQQPRETNHYETTVIYWWECRYVYYAARDNVAQQQRAYVMKPERDGANLYAKTCVMRGAAQNMRSGEWEVVFMRERTANQYEVNDPECECAAVVRERVKPGDASARKKREKKVVRGATKR